MKRRGLLRGLAIAGAGAGGYALIDNGIVSVDLSAIERALETSEKQEQSRESTDNHQTQTAVATETERSGPTGPDPETVSQQAHLAVNEARKNNDQPEIEWDEQLYKIARNYSQKMAKNGFFAHKEPDGDNFQDRYREADYYCKVEISSNRSASGAENIAKTHWRKRVDTDEGVVAYDSAAELGQGLVDQWMNSKGHRENILQNYWENEAVGIYVTDDDVVYATQNFC